MPEFALLAYPGCKATGVAVAADVLNVLNSLWQREQGGAEPLFRWRVLSPDGAGIATATGLQLAAQGRWEDAGSCPVAVLPAIHYTRAAELLQQLHTLTPALAILPQLHAAGTTIGAGCTGTFLLAESGLLDDRRATTSWWLQRLFAQRYPRVKLRAEELLTEEDRLVCAGANNARADLILRLAEPYAGRDLVWMAAKLLLVDANRISQSAYMSLPEQATHADPVVERVQLRLQTQLAEPHDLDALAALAEVSPRTLIRRFKDATGLPPIAYLQQLRIDTAKRLLETTPASVDQIVAQVGYQDVSTFRKLFKRGTGLSPREYRARFTLGSRWP